MKKAAILAVIAIVLIFSIALVAYNNKTETVEEPVLQFKTFTTAVCEEKNDLLYCKDEVFVNCDGEMFNAADIRECNGIKVEVPEFTGFAVLEKK